MTNGNSADLKPSQKWTERHKALALWRNKILCDGRNVSAREEACFEDGFEAAREALSVCADGGKDSSAARDMADFIEEDGLSEQFRIWRECRDAAIVGDKEMNDEQLKEIARACAKAKPQSYYAEPFEPHEWVMDALRAVADGGKGEAVARVNAEGFIVETGALPLAPGMELYTAPQAECAPREAQPVGPRTTLNYDGTFDTPCAHCGGNGCFGCLKSAAPTPERADAAPNPSDKQEAVCNCGATCQDNGEACRYTVKQKAPIGEVEMTETGSRGVRWLTPEPPDEGTPLYTAAHLVTPSDKKEPVARYPHAAIGAALISSGIYDRMNDITGGDREARMLIQELIAKVDPVLDRWHATVVAASPSERADAEKDAALTDEAIRRVAVAYYADGSYDDELIGFARAILAANKEQQP